MSGDLTQFLVAARSGAAANDLADFEAAMGNIPGASVISRGGGPTQPRLVVALPTAAADQMRARFGATLVIEHNAMLDPF